MGAGKSTVGRRLATELRLPFVDADEEIEKAAGLSISEIFQTHGEQEFRRGEKRVIARLLKDPPHVLATGGGAYMDPDTRELIQSQAISIWLKADLQTLTKRVAKRNHRPLLNEKNPTEVLRELMSARYPVYAKAHITVESVDRPQRETINAVLQGLNEYCESIQI